MSILFEHNQKAYEAAASMLQETGRAAIIHPTGTGKSFIAFKLCADHAECNICWLSPSEYIFATQLEKWGAAGGKELKNIEFITYARLMRMPGDTMEEIHPDYIILDEFHRCGAAQWGGGVSRLREMYPEAKVLGLSATNIRYLDNQRDMAWELFGGNVASELTLGAAIATGILPAPKYVLSVYSYQKELKRYELRVRQAKNKAVQGEAERELAALRRALEKADGLAEVFAKHMDGEVAGGAGTVGLEQEDFMQGHSAGERLPQEGYGKYIVFCTSYEHLLTMRELAGEWFAKVDPAPHIYTAYSDDSATGEEFEAFKADTSKHLKLLYCIDMLNEGIHVDGLSGVILLRPTVSPTIYKQQIGRALAAGGKKTPVIFDIVMNIENLCSIGAIEEELREAVFAFRADGRGGEVITEHFQVIDEVADCRRLFAQLTETLAASWDAMYAMAKEYYESHGNLEIPAIYTTQDGYCLGAWVATQRKVYNKKTAGILSREQIRRLEQIGMRWQGTQEAAWEKNFAEAEKYFKEHGDLEVPADFVAEGGCRLGRWLRRQREMYQKLRLQNGVSREGDGSMGADAMKNPDFKEGIGCHQDVGGVRNFALGQRKKEKQKEAAISGNIKKYKRDLSGPERESIHMEHVRRLTEIGMVWENGDPWERRFALAKEYYEKHGNLKMAADYVVEGVWLDRWLREQKARWEAELENDRGSSQGKMPCDGVEGEEDGISKAQAGREFRKPLTQGQKEKLSSIGVVPGVSQAELSWREQYGEAEEFYRQHGNLSIPKQYIARNGKNLGIWLQRQRAGRRNGVLAGWQVTMLDGLGMVWELPDAWGQGFSHAEEYFRENGHLAVPNNFVCADGYRLGKWISNQRCAYGGGLYKGLTREQVSCLEGIGMVWSARPGRRKRNVGEEMKKSSF